MLKRRLIPVLFLKDGWMVRSELFTEHQFIGDPVSHVQRMMQWEVDELIVINIGNDAGSISHNRQDYRTKPVSDITEFIRLIAIECGMPLTFGGGIRTVKDALLRIKNGADKIILNNALHGNLQLLDRCINILGSQAIVGSIDYRLIDGKRIVFSDFGKNNTGLLLTEFAIKCSELGVGELFINSIDRDGGAMGFDIEGIESVASRVNVPVIGCGGAGHQSHFLRAFGETTASAIAAGNIFHFKENAYPLAKIYLKKSLNDIR